MSEPYFAEVLSGCTSIESAKDAWVRFGAPAWRELEVKLAKTERALKMYRDGYRKASDRAKKMTVTLNLMGLGGR